MTKMIMIDTIQRLFFQLPLINLLVQKINRKISGVVYQKRGTASIGVAYWNSFGWRCAQYTMSCFLYYYFRELKNRTMKENEEK